MKHAEVILRIALAAGGGSACFGLARALCPASEPFWIADLLLMVGLSLGLWAGLVVGDTFGRGRTGGGAPPLWAAGYALTGGLAAGGVAAVLLTMASTPTELASIATPPTPSIVSVIPDMLATIIAASIAAGVAAAAIEGAPRLTGRRGTHLWGGLLGGGFGGLLYELILYFLPKWGRGLGADGLVQSPELLAAAWLSAMAGAGVVVAERLGVVLTLHRGDVAAALYPGECILGSSALCDVALAGPGVRPAHLRTKWAGKGVSVEALEGAELAVNGEGVTEATLSDGDELRLGRAHYRVAYNRLRVRSEAVRRRPGPTEPLRGAADGEAVRLVIVEGPLLGETVEVPQGRSVIGSASEAHLPLPGERVAPVHATLTRDGSAVSIQAEEVSSEVLVNGTRVTSCSLQPGDRVTIGEHLMLVVHPGGARRPPSP